MKLETISVVMLGVANLDRSVEFYTKKLGMKMKQRVPGFAFLDGGGVTLALSEPLAKATGKSAGAAEVVFGVNSVTSAYDELKAQGVDTIQQPKEAYPPMWVANFTDPDGHHLSVFGPRGL